MGLALSIYLIRLQPLLVPELRHKTSGVRRSDFLNDLQHQLYGLLRGDWHSTPIREGVFELCAHRDSIL
jgi:hypothetical protein